jgi:uncharacterized membrane protein
MRRLVIILLVIALLGAVVWAISYQVTDAKIRTVVVFIFFVLVILTYIYINIRSRRRRPPQV